jgi:uncharacterized protein YycO
MSKPSLNSDGAIPERLSDFSFERPIPKAVREFGRAIDPKILEPGDLFLVAHKKPRWHSGVIVSQQSKQFAQEHACWHHAAVCGGGFEICEATVSGVKAYEYWDYMNDGFDVRIRRLRNASPEQRARVAYYAATNCNTGYGFLNLPALASFLSNGNPWGRRLFASSGVVCSQLYFEACMRAGFLLAPISSDQVCPAHLSISPQLMDVPLSWVPV